MPFFTPAVRARRSLDEMPRRPGWARLAALVHKRSCGFDVAQYELLIRPGPRMGEAARAAVAPYTPEAMAREYLSLYERLLHR